MYKTILFDLDGCLVHSLPAWVESFRETYKLFNIEKTEEEIVHALYNFDYQNDQEVPDVKTFSAKIYEHYYTHLDLMVLHDYVPETLKILKKNKRTLGVVTSSFRETALTILETHDIAQYFDVVMAWEDTVKNKPDPLPVTTAIKELKGKKKTSIMIGDSDQDIMAAKNAGITSVWYHPQHNETFFPPDHFAHLEPDHTVKHMKEFLSIIGV